MDLEMKYFDRFDVLENDEGKIIESKIELHNIYINVSIILSKNIIAKYEIKQCINIINNFLKIYEGEKIGIIPMKEVLEGIDFSNIVIDYINGKIILIVYYYDLNINFEFNNKYEIEKINIEEIDYID
jgi:hypothetical protein